MFVALNKLFRSNFGSFLFLALFVFTLLPPLFFGKTLYWGDISLYFTPMQGFAQQSLKHGALPLWNPYILSGQPFLGNPQMSLFYPTSALLFFFPGWIALNITVILHAYLCGLFSYLYLIRHTSGRLPALAGACIYMGSGCLLGRLQFPPVIQTAAYFPLLILLVERLVEVPTPGNRHKCFLGISFTSALTILAAHTQTAYFMFLCTALYFFTLILVKACDSNNKGGSNRLDFLRMALKKRFKPLKEGLEATQALINLKIFVCALIVGVLISSAYLLPTLQLLGSSPRTHLSLIQANRFYMDFPHLLGLIFPHFAGHPATGDYYARGNAWEPAVFVGWVPIILIWFAFRKNSKSATFGFWGSIGIVGIWLALGINAGLFSVAFFTLPGLASFHDPARFLLWTAFALSVLTAFGFDALMRLQLKNRSAKSCALMISILIPLIWYGREWNPTTSPENLTSKSVQLDSIRKTKGAGRTTMIGASLFWKRFVDDGYDDFSVEEGERRIQEMRNSLLSNQDMEAKLESASGYEPVPILGMAELDGLSRIAQKRGEANYSRILSLIDVSLVLQPRQFKAMDFGISSNVVGETESPNRESRLLLWKNRDRIGRYWTVRKTRNVEGKMRIAAVLASPGFEPLKLAVISVGETDVQAGMEWGSGIGSEEPVRPVIWRKVSDTKVEMIVDSGKTPSFLVCSVAATPGWKAFVDKIPTPVIRTNGALMGAFIPAGLHKIDLVYSPDSFRFGLYLSLSTSLAIIFYILIRYFRQKAELKFRALET